MALMYIPRQTSPFQQMLPGFLQNMVFNQMAAKRQSAAISQEQERQKTIRIEDLMTKGWREATGPVKGAVPIAGTMMVPPKVGFKEQKVSIGGKQYPVYVKTLTPYGEEAQVTEVGKPFDPKVQKQGKVWIHDPVKKIKRQVSPDEAVKLISSKGGWVQGQPYGRQEEGFEIYGYDEQGRPLMRMGGKGSKLTPSTATTIQKDVVNLSDQLNEVVDLESNVYKEALTMQGQLARAGYRLADWAKIPIGEKGKKHLQSTRVFIEKIEQIFNAYRKEITGAQAAMKEISMLRDSILNKKLTPAEFEASLKSYKDKIQRQLRLKRMILARGSVSGKTGVSQKELNERLNNLYMAGGDADDVETDRYGDELLQQTMQRYEGITEIDAQAIVINQLRKEGYEI